MKAGPLAGRGAVVTGGGRGIGAAIARALAGAGAAVIVAARTSKEIERVAEELGGGKAKAWPVTCDVTDEAAVKRLGETARARMGAVDILVNNAGVASSAPLRSTTLAEWKRMIDGNATAAFLCLREFAPEMAERGWGRVVNVASIAGLVGGKYIASYSAAKHAVMGLSRSVAIELAGTGVTVNAVCPAYVDTPMTQRTLSSAVERAGISREEALAAVLATVGQERLITAEEVAVEVLRLCGEDAATVSGQAIVMGGGAGAGAGGAGAGAGSAAP